MNHGLRSKSQCEKEICFALNLYALINARRLEARFCLNRGGLFVSMRIFI